MALCNVPIDKALATTEALMSSTVLTVLIVGALASWGILVVPQLYFLKTLTTKAATTAFIPTMVESLFDAIEMAAALLIVSNFDSDLSSIELAETIICANVVTLLIFSSCVDVRFLMFIRNLQDSNAHLLFEV